MFRILLVDDEPAVLRLLQIVLEAESFQIVTAKSASEAKSLLGKTEFDLVLTDMRMETLTAGYDVVRAARQLHPRPAIAILTAFPISRSEWQPSGADALFVKGTEILNLPDQLKALLKRRPKTEPAKNSQQRRSV